MHFVPNGVPACLQKHRQSQIDPLATNKFNIVTDRLTDSTGSRDASASKKHRQSQIDPLATNKFNIVTDRQTDRPTDICTYRDPVGLTIEIEW